MKYLLLLLPLLFVILPAFASSNDLSNLCVEEMKKGHTCYQVEKPTLHLQQGQTSSLNWSMDIIAPDGTCNIDGFLKTDGSCSYQSIVLSNDNFTSLKNNISILAVIHIQNSAMPSQDYCKVAIWTWNSQDITFKNKYNESLVVPSYCVKPIPEFPLLPALILGISISVIILLTRKVILNSSISEI